MATIGQFGMFYTQLADRLYHGLEWQYNKYKEAPDQDAERAALAKLLDTLIADAVNRDITLAQLQAATREFAAIRDAPFSDAKYAGMFKILGIDPAGVHGYVPQLFGVFEYDARSAV
jgi:hypothetical protein